MFNVAPHYLRMESALRAFAAATGTQDQRHIKPMHQYVALRLVLEGGFLPDEVTPRPPLHHAISAGRHRLILDPARETTSERTVIGGIKSKNVDVVVNKEGIGPVICVSMKGTMNAFRNLTNRMEELIGDCANLHMMYPGLVFGFLHLLRANRAGQPNIKRNDVSVGANGQVVGSIERWHNILVELSGRKMIHDDVMRYESIALTIVETAGPAAGNIFSSFPRQGSPLLAESFFTTLYNLYDLRFPYKMAGGTLAKRVEWDENSPAFADIRSHSRQELDVALGYTPRIV
jgi:hypothetical protein